MEVEAERFYAKAADEGRRDAETAGRSGAARKGPRKYRGKTEPQNPQSQRSRRRRQNAQAGIRAAIRAAGAGGLMDGSVSTLAPLFAAAFATHHNWQTFLVGLAASIGAGISMGIGEALSDDGSGAGRGPTWLGGITCGLATALGVLRRNMPLLVPG